MSTALTLSDINFDITTQYDVLDATMIVGAALHIKPIYKALMRAIRYQKTDMRYLWTDYARFNPHKEYGLLIDNETGEINIITSNDVDYYTDHVCSLHFV